jgi:hypothetical protein
VAPDVFVRVVLWSLRSVFLLAGGALVWFVPVTVSKHDDGRNERLPGRQQRAEVGVGRDERASFARGAVEDLHVARGLEAVGADVDRVMSGLAQSFGHRRRQRVVDQELHRSGTMGSSRSRTASAA